MSDISSSQIKEMCRISIYTKNNEFHLQGGGHKCRTLVVVKLKRCAVLAFTPKTMSFTCKVVRNVGHYYKVVDESERIWCALSLRLT